AAPPHRRAGNFPDLHNLTHSSSPSPGENISRKGAKTPCLRTRDLIPRAFAPSRQTFSFLPAIEGKLLFVLARIDHLAVERRRRHHHRAHQQGPALRASLPADEIAVRGGRGNFPAVELVGIHRQTHGAAGLAPLKSRFAENF